MRPKETEYASFYGRYIDLVPEEDARVALIDSGIELVQMFKSERFNNELAGLRYAESKWTVAEVLLHLIDVENVMLNRALWAARGEQSELPGFDHNSWVTENQPPEVDVSYIIQWFRVQRDSTVHFFENIVDDKFDRQMKAGGNPFTVRSLAFIISGHTRHHVEVLRERYLTLL